MIMMPLFSKVSLKNLLNNRYFLLIAVFIIGFLVRWYYFTPERILFGYDQVGDLISARKIADNHDFIVKELFGSQIGINHGVLFSYFTALFYWLSDGQPMGISRWYVFLNSLSVLSICFFCFSVFKDKFIGLLGGLLLAFSNYQILLSGWVSNTSWAFVLIPIYFGGFWQYRKKNNWGLVLASFIMGLLIQSQMLMVYYFLTLPIIFVVLKLKFPNLKTVILSGLVFLIAVSTMILAEIKSNFSSFKILGNLTSSLDESHLSVLEKGKLFFLDYLDVTKQNLNFEGGLLVKIFFILVIFGGLYMMTKDNETKKESVGVKLVLIMLASPILMLLIGYHKQPWTLFGMIPAVFILSAYVMSKVPLRKLLVISYLALFVSGFQKNLVSDKLFISQEPSSILQGQLEVLDYTYREANGETFAINAVTYPLYYNTYWSYHYPWYSKKIGQVLPGWMGGDQLYPYNTLPRTTGKEKIFFMIIDETKAISQYHKMVGKKWGLAEGKLVSEKLVGGFTVQKFIRHDK